MSSLISKNLQVGSDPTATNNFTIFQPATPDGTLRIGNGNTGITASLLALTSAGNFGIGTSSPGAKLQVGDGTATTEIRIDGDGGSGNGGFVRGYKDTVNPSWYVGDLNPIAGGADSGLCLYSYGATPQVFFTNGNERMRLDSAGNLGLGVTPSAWSFVSALQVKNASIGAIGSAPSFAQLAANTYYDGSVYKYISSSWASRYAQNSSQHQWYIAPSGTAGNAISFTQAMTLTAGGDLLVGTTSLVTDASCFNYSPGNAWGIFGHGTGVASGTEYIKFRLGSAQIGSITQNGTTAVAYNTSSDYRLKNITGPITNSGAYIDSLNPVEGTWKADGSTFVGLIAHEVQEASRTPVATGVKDGEQMQGMDYSSAEIIANMLAELKSLRARVAQLEAK